MSEVRGLSLSQECAVELVRSAMIAHPSREVQGSPWGNLFLREGVARNDLFGCVAVLGAFDGFHLGHAELLKDALESASAAGVPLVALTFWPDPSEVVGLAQRRLMDARQRVDALLGAGASAVLMLRFTKEFARLSPSSFVDLLMSLLEPAEVHVGENFRFGHKGEGTTDDLERLCAEKGVRVHVHTTFEAAGEPVSASRIRSLIVSGKIEEAQALLGHPLCLTGTVSHGRGEGTGLGFATANLLIEKERVLLAPGVYAGYTVVDGIAWPTAANAGSPASFGGGDDNLIEAHLVGFSRAIYGETASFVPLTMLRPEQRFATREELIETVNGNIEWVAENLGTEGLEVWA